jgi:hypothetical protein
LSSSIWSLIDRLIPVNWFDNDRNPLEIMLAIPSMPRVVESKISTYTARVLDSTSLSQPHIPDGEWYDFE